MLRRSILLAACCLLLLVLCEASDNESPSARQQTFQSLAAFKPRFGRSDRWPNAVEDYANSADPFQRNLRLEDFKTMTFIKPRLGRGSPPMRTFKLWMNRDGNDDFIQDIYDDKSLMLRKSRMQDYKTVNFLKPRLGKRETNNDIQPEYDDSDEIIKNDPDEIERIFGKLRTGEGFFSDNKQDERK